jgi:hypothetical protein
MGFPVGFRDDRMFVDLDAIERVRRLGGLGSIQVASKHGGRGADMDWEVDGLGMPVTVDEAKSWKPLAKTKVKFPSGNAFYGEPDVRIRINGDVVDEEIRTSGVRRAMFDPRVRAVVLNQALRRGLYDGVVAANVDREKFRLSIAAYSPFILGMGMQPNHSALLTASAVGAGFLATMGMNIGNAVANHESVGHYMRDVRKSLFCGASFDRCAAGLAATVLTTFIKARD